MFELKLAPLFKMYKLPLAARDSSTSRTSWNGKSSKKYSAQRKVNMMMKGAFNHIEIIIISFLFRWWAGANDRRSQKQPKLFLGIGSHSKWKINRMQMSSYFFFPEWPMRSLPAAFTSAALHVFFPTNKLNAFHYRQLFVVASILQHK